MEPTCSIFDMMADIWDDDAKPGDVDLGAGASDGSKSDDEFVRDICRAKRKTDNGDDAEAVPS